LESLHLPDELLPMLESETGHRSLTLIWQIQAIFQFSVLKCISFSSTDSNHLGRGMTKWENSSLQTTLYSQSHMRWRENEVVHLLGALDKHKPLTLVYV